MRKYTYFLLGLLCGAIFFSGTAVLANSGVLAQITSQIFFLNGEQIGLFAYNVDDTNYIKLRDAAALFGAKIEYIEETDSVYITTDKTDIPEEFLAETPDKGADAEKEIIIDGTAYAREDFRQRQIKAYSAISTQRMRTTPCGRRQQIQSRS